MPRPRPERPSYHLRRVGRYWRIVWWDAAAGVTRARSTGESDRARAEATLQAFLAELSAPPPVDRLTVAVLLKRYLADRRGQVADHQRLVDACKPLAAQLGWLPVDGRGHRFETCSAHHGQPSIAAITRWSILGAWNAL